MSASLKQYAFIAERYHTPGAAFLYDLLCRALIGASSAAELAGLTPSDWQLFAVMAISEGVAGPLWDASASGGWRGQIPDEARKLLHQGVLHGTISNRLLLAELERVLAVLANHSIPVLLLKGAALALTLYERPGLRAMGDLDILIEEQHVGPACAAIAALGYRAEMSRLRRWLTAPLLHELNFDVTRTAPIHLELHWNLLAGESSRYRSGMAWFWERAQSIRVGEQTAYVLAAGPMLLHLSTHLTLKHGEERALLRWYHDIHLLIERHADSLDWEEVLEQAANTRWSAGVHTALVDVQERFGTPVPAEVIRRLASAYADDDRAYLARRSGHGHLGRAVGLWQTHYWRGKLALLALALLRVGSREGGVDGLHRR